MNQAMLLRYDPRLIEEAVFLALRDRPETREFQKQRERIYEVADPEERERVFGELNRSWFARLGLGKIVEQALHEQSQIASSVASCFVGCVAQAKEEGAELFVAPDEELEGTARRIVSIRLRPESLLQPESLLTFLRHELFHVADMLDPAFRLRTDSAKSRGRSDLRHSDHQSLSRPVGCDDQWPHGAARLDFCIAFAMNNLLSLCALFRCWRGKVWSYSAAFLTANTTHILNLPLSRSIQEPLLELFMEPPLLGHTARCADFQLMPLSPSRKISANEVIAAINRDFPQWAPALGLCAQCADLYRASQLSIAAAKELPGWH